MLKGRERPDEESQSARRPGSSLVLSEAKKGKMLLWKLFAFQREL